MQSKARNVFSHNYYNLGCLKLLTYQNPPCTILVLLLKIRDWSLPQFNSTTSTLNESQVFGIQGFE